MIALVGIPIILIFAWGLSEDRWAVPVRVVAGGLVLQWVLAIILLRVPLAGDLLQLVQHWVDAAQAACDQGTQFVFGYLAGAPAPFAATDPGAAYILGFRALPMVLLISALSALLFHWGVMQRIVGLFALLLRGSLGLGGALGLGAAAHIFVGMIEAPLLIRPYLHAMGRGELFALMTVGLAGIAGTMMVIYAAILGPVIPGALGHILVASVISTPAGLSIAALMVPFRPAPAGAVAMALADPPANSVEAITRGTGDGVVLLANIIAMLIVAVALVGLVNMALAVLPDLHGAPLTLQRLAGFLFRPIMLLIGIPWSDIGTAGSIMGTKTVLNELVAYVDLAHQPDGALQPKTRLILTYALCGFANFGSLGIMLGGLGAMVPGRRAEIASLGGKSILAGTLATSLSGAVAGLIG